LEGGNKAYYTNTEVLFPIPYLEQFNVKGIVFFDAGNAWAEDQDFSFNLRYAAGVGLRLNTPLGVLSVYAGHNLNRREGEKRNVFNFTVGSSF
ncbi:MAG TPA: BamA/TamA family outer membrane protein, partial [Candidatus Methylomirabilis sp.]